MAKKKTAKKKKIVEKIDYKSEIKKKKISIKGKKKIKTIEQRKKIVEGIRKKTKTKLNKIKKSEGKYILSLDLSKNKPGICVLDLEGKLETVYSIPGSTKNKAMEIYLSIEELIKKYDFKIVLFESTFTRFQKVTRTLNLYQGIIYSLLLLYGLEVKQVSNLKVKRIFGVKTKEELFAEICSLYDIDLEFKEFNDETDAIAIGLAYLIDEKIALKME